MDIQKVGCAVLAATKAGANWQMRDLLRPLGDDEIWALFELLSDSREEVANEYEVRARGEGQRLLEVAASLGVCAYCGRPVAVGERFCIGRECEADWREENASWELDPPLSEVR